MHGANSHHLSDAETVSEVVEWIASVVLLNSNLQQRYYNNSVLPSIPKACRPNKPSAQKFSLMWDSCALMWPQAPPPNYALAPVMP